jgi:hypothetical protein
MLEVASPQAYLAPMACLAATFLMKEQAMECRTSTALVTFLA